MVKQLQLTEYTHLFVEDLGDELLIEYHCTRDPGVDSLVGSTTLSKQDLSPEYQ